MARIADHWWIVLVRGLSSFALAGVLLLVSGWSSVRTLALAFGIWAVVDGGVSLAVVLGVRGARIGPYLGRGCLGLAAGAFALLLPGAAAVALYTIVGAWAIGTGALEMIFASRAWFLVPRALGFMLLGGLALGFGLWLLPFPLLSVAGLRGFLVAFAIVNGVAATVFGTRLHPPAHPGLPSRA